MFPRLRTALRSSAHSTPATAPATPSFVPRFFSSSLPRPASTVSSASPSTNRTVNQSRAHPFIYVLGLMPIVTFGLGSWQVQRLRWKLDMIDQLEAKLHQDTVRLPARIDPAAIPEFSYRKVFVTGTFDDANEIMLGPKTREGELGYNVITPLVRWEGQDTIMVNRGFIKRSKTDPATRPESLSEGPVEIVGMLRDQDIANTFTPPNNPDKGEWVFPNIEEMAKHTGAEPVLVDEIYIGNAGQISMRLSRGVPVGRAAVIELRNQHMTYAITWYALSLATAVMFFKLVKRPSRRLTMAEYRKMN